MSEACAPTAQLAATEVVAAAVASPVTGTLPDCLKLAITPAYKVELGKVHVMDWFPDPEITLNAAPVESTSGEESPDTKSVVQPDPVAVGADTLLESPLTVATTRPALELGLTVPELTEDPDACEVELRSSTEDVSFPEYSLNIP